RNQWAIRMRKSPRLCASLRGALSLEDLVMPEPWDRVRVAVLIDMLRELLEVADLDDDEADAVCAILVPKLWRRSGLDGGAVAPAVRAVLAARRDWAALSSRRH